MICFDLSIFDRKRVRTGIERPAPTTARYARVDVADPQAVIDFRRGLDKDATSEQYSCPEIEEFFFPEAPAAE